MATAVGFLKSSLHAPAAELSGNEFLVKREKLHQMKQRRLACSPTCTLQIRQDDALNHIQQLSDIFCRKSSKGFDPLTQERSDVLQVGSLQRWSKIGENLRSKRIRAELLNLATLASDRTEMHSVSDIQRDDWNLLFHSTISLISVFSASAAAINGPGHQAPGLCVVTSILGLGTAALMALVSRFQPSEVAEEQRQAARARSFRRLTVEVEATLGEYPTCSAAKSAHLKEKFGTLHALDTRFPLPLTPVVLEKFPQAIRPSLLSEIPMAFESTPIIRVKTLDLQPSNGWTSEIEEQLRVSSLLRSSDVSASVEAAETITHMNKIVTVASPMLALTASFLNMMPGMLTFPGVGSALMVCALFVHSLSNGLQLGALYENHRNVAGYDSDVERSIETSLRIPVVERQDGRFFQERLAMQVERNPSKSSVVSRGHDRAEILW